MTTAGILAGLPLLFVAINCFFLLALGMVEVRDYGARRAALSAVPLDKMMGDKLSLIFNI